MSEIKQGLYKHYKGKNYQVLGTAYHSETLEQFALYFALYESEFGKNALWVRPAQMFNEKIQLNNHKIQRFQLVDSKNKFEYQDISTEIKQGDYKHFKGGFVFVLGNARHSETLEELIAYKALYNCRTQGYGSLWIRPKEMFLGNVENNIPRFKYLETNLSKNILSVHLSK